MDGPPALFCFWRGKKQPSARVPEQCPPNDQPALRQVDVVPLEAERLTESHAGRPEDNPKRVPAAPDRCGEQMVKLVTVECRHFARPWPRRRHEFCGIPPDNSPMHRLLEGKVEDAMHLLNAARGEARFQERRVG